MMIYPGGGYVGEYFPLTPSEPPVLELVGMSSAAVDAVGMSSADPLDLVGMSSDDLDVIGSSS